jgi:acetoin utilization deacetylase AcuC-like enzyme
MSWFFRTRNALVFNKGILTTNDRALLHKFYICPNVVSIGVTVFFNEEFYAHEQAHSHPESPERLRGIVKSLQDNGLWKGVIPSRRGDSDHLGLVHDKDYVDFIRTCGECSITLDTTVHRETYEIAALSAECAIDAARYSKEKGRPSFALTRPPGHHAGPDYGMGFCYFNNISIAAEYLLKEGDKRIAIIDPDVHHGNGTEQVFRDRSDVLYVSTHQGGIFPGTGDVDFIGAGDGEGYTLNMPFASGCGDSTYDFAYAKVALPVLRQFRPDAILVSFGTDGHYRDPLASLSLSSEGYLRLLRDLIALSDECGGRITFMLEGGYDIPALSEIVAATVGLFQGVDVPLEFTEIVDNSCLGRAVVERCARNASEYWDL